MPRYLDYIGELKENGIISSDQYNQLLEFNDYLKNRLAYSSRKQYMLQVAKLFQEFDISERGLKDFLHKGKQQHYNPTMKKKVLGRIYHRKYAVKKFIEFLCDTGKISREERDNYYEEIDNVQYRIREREGTKTARPEDIFKLIDSAEDDGFKLLLMLSFDTGVRVYSLIRVRIRDFSQGSDGIELKVKEKGGDFQDPLVHEKTWDHIQKYVDEHNLDDDHYLFFRKKRITREEFKEFYNKMYSKLKNSSKDIVGKSMSWHWLRRCFGVYWYEKTGHDLRATQEALRHSDPKVTARYLKLKGEKIRKLFKREKRPW